MNRKSFPLSDAEPPGQLRDSHRVQNFRAAGEPVFKAAAFVSPALRFKEGQRAPGDRNPAGSSTKRIGS